MPRIEKNVNILEYDNAIENLTVLVYFVVVVKIDLE